LPTLVRASSRIITQTTPNTVSRHVLGRSRTVQTCAFLPPFHGAALCRPMHVPRGCSRLAACSLAAHQPHRLT
jgi:hypothetical protein